MFVWKAEFVGPSRISIFVNCATVNENGPTFLPHGVVPVTLGGPVRGRCQSSLLTLLQGGGGRQAVDIF
jgi:hypothetical protein